MRHQPEIGCGDSVSESCQSLAQVKDACYHLLRGDAELAVINHNVLPVLLQHQVDMHPRSGFAHGDLRRKTDLHPVPVAQHPENPLCYQQLLHSLIQRHMQKLNLVLFIIIAIL